MLKILFLAANPRNTDQQRLAEESRAVDESVRTAAFRDRIDIHSHWAVRYSDLSELLLRYKPHIVHFSGLGSSSGEIILEDGNAGSHPVPAAAFSRLFAILKDDIRCVVLNACYSHAQAKAIARHIDCVVGMSHAISAAAAIDFATAFYQALGYGRSIQTAFDLACNRIDLANLAGQDAPRLLSLHVDANKVMLVDAGAESALPGAPGQAARARAVRIEGHISNVAAGAQAAIGLGNSQAITNAAPAPLLTSAELDQVRDLLAEVKSRLAASGLPEHKKLIADEFAGQLELELAKQDERPDMSVIKVAGNWLLKNAPDVTSALAALFLHPAVAKMVKAAGEPAVNWVQQQFVARSSG